MVRRGYDMYIYMHDINYMIRFKNLGYNILYLTYSVEGDSVMVYSMPSKLWIKPFNFSMVEGLRLKVKGF